MSKNLRKCMKTMHLLCSTQNKKLRKSIIQEMAKHQCFFEAIYEIVNNIHLKNIKLKNLKSLDKKRLKKFLPLLRKIHSCPKNKSIRKKLVVQTGGWLPIVLPVLTTVVGELISHAFSKKGDSGSS